MVNTNLDKIGKKLNQLKGKYNVNNNISNIKIMAKKNHTQKMYEISIITSKDIQH